MTISGAGSAKLAVRMFLVVGGLEAALYVTPVPLAVTSGLVAASAVMLPWMCARGIHWFMSRKASDAGPVKVPAANSFTPFSLVTWMVRAGVVAAIFSVLRGHQWECMLLSAALASMTAYMAWMVAAHLSYVSRHRHTEVAR